MRILWLSHFVPYPPKGGNRQRSYYLLRELAREHEVHLLMLDPRYPPASEEVEDERPVLEKVVASVERIPLKRGKGICGKASRAAANLWKRSPVTADLLYEPEAERLIHDIIRQKKIDAVHVDTVDLMIYGHCFERIPFVLNHHNIESILLERLSISKRNPLLRWYYRFQAKKVRTEEAQNAPAAQLNLVVSGSDGAELSKIAPECRWEVVENGADTDYFQPLTDPGDKEPPTLIWTGGMSWHPNRDAVRFFLTEVWPGLVKEIPDLRLFLIGRNPPKEARTAPHAGRIEAPGFVDDVRRYLARSHVFIVPIRVGGGTRLKIVDAMAAGKAVVSSAIGYEGLRVVDGEHLVRADSPEEYQDKIERLLKDRSLRKDLGKRARSLVEKEYAWQVVGEKIRKVYSE